MKLVYLPLAIFLFSNTNNVAAYEWTGFAAIESLLYNHEAIQPQQKDNNISFSFNPEYHTSWNDNKQSLTIEPFMRWDYADEERSHFDFREFVFYSNMGDWEVKAGIGKVFWGVTESQHLVDIINQTDAIESIDGEDKLGQPLVNATFIKDWGNIDIFVLPYFRTRTFAGIEGRLRTQPYIDSNNELYESDKKEKHIDYAIRYSHTIDDWDLGLSHFYGTSRSPEFIPGLDGNGQPVLTPIYYLLHQTGIDLQLVYDDWLWKLEAVHKRSNSQKYNAYTFGFEYTLVGIQESNLDLGLISEYLYDTRGQQATSPFQRDVMLGARLNFNDTQSSEILLGMIVDLDSNERLYSLEAATRLNDNLKLEIEARVFSNTGTSSVFYNLRNDDHIKVELQYYF